MPFKGLRAQSAERLIKIPGLQEFYDSIMQQDLQLIDGVEHTARYPTGAGHPFFLTKEPAAGTIYMHNREFSHSFIRYDVLNDNLQVYHFTESGPRIIDLNKNKIEGFSIEGHHFINITALNNPGLTIVEGFYEAKYEGRISYLLRHEKVYLDYASGSGGGYEEHLLKYLSTPQGWYRISNRKSLFRAFGDDPEAIKKYIRKSGISLKLATDDEIIRIIKYYESLD
jgi:hypothetical protein